MKRAKSTRGPKQSQESIHLDGRAIAYTLILTERKSVGITIHPDMSVIVRAPHNSNHQDIDQLIRARGPWILRHLQRFAEKPPAPKSHALQQDTTLQNTSLQDATLQETDPQDITLQNYTYLFLGERLPLHIAPSPTNQITRPTICLENGRIYLQIKDIHDQEEIQAQLDKWARSQAEVIFTRQMLIHFLKFQHRVPKLPTLKIRRMKARWGSCSSKGVITLNQKLIHMDETLIDYVIVHELCHLIEHNHSKAYYALLTQMMPDWAERRQELNALGMPE